MANGWGGARANAGRKRKAEIYASEIAAAERRVADRLPRVVDNLELLADGGFEQITETYEPAGLVFVEAPLLSKDKTPQLDANGHPIIVRQLAFPNRRPDDLVCVRRTRSIAAPDRAANIYMVDRILGRPVAAVEVEGEVHAGDGLVEAFAGVVARIYGQPSGESGGDGS